LTARYQITRRLTLLFEGAILQTGDVPMRAEGGRLTLDLPPLTQDAVESGEIATHIAGPGYVLRFEHADPARAAGAYAKIFPALQRQAANALEAVIELGLGEQEQREEWGVIEIMGFDTNDPHGHLDAPSHVHMHLRWPYNVGTQIGHFYISETGRLSVNHVGITGYHLPSRTFGPGEPFTTLSPKGVTAYTQTITTDGGLRLAAVEGRACQISPIGVGFQDGAQVACDGRVPVDIHVEDDLAQGRIEARTGPIREVFHYDRDTGTLTSPAARPPEEASGVVPTFHLTMP
jgi:hypothetical protein